MQAGRGRKEVFRRLLLPAHVMSISNKWDSQNVKAMWDKAKGMSPKGHVAGRQVRVSLLSPRPVQVCLFLPPPPPPPPPCEGKGRGGACPECV